MPRFGDLTAHVVTFCRALRTRGLAVGPREAADALRALSSIDVSDRRLCYLALRTVLVTRHEDFPIFDAVFAQFWNPPVPEPSRLQDLVGDELPGDGTDGEQPKPSVMEWLDQALRAEGEETVPAYSPTETLMHKDFSAFSASELDEMSRLVVAIARKVATRLSRRTRAVQRSHHIDLRRTIRHSLRRGGEVLDLAYRRRKIQKTRVVLLADVSGSMDLYSRFLIQFIFALQHALGQIETFVFSTSLTRVTDAMSEADLRHALDEVAQRVPDWSGGTKIGYSLRTFLDRHGRDLLGPRTVVIVISDGWDTGEIDILRSAMEELQRRAGRIIWLNPLLGGAGYEPICQGMRAALPYVDVFASAHNLESLRRLERHLVAKGR
jgi:uncharacterized protein with von Willebrand factor type A (vWA) domain